MKLAGGFLVQWFMLGYAGLKMEFRVLKVALLLVLVWLLSICIFNVF